MFASTLENKPKLLFLEPVPAKVPVSQPLVSISNPNSATLKPTAMDWRRQQKVDTMMTQNSKQLLARLSQQEHAAGVRQAGCPCCDPDNPSNYVDSMMML
jgi:hypothetical protein